MNKSSKRSSIIYYFTKIFICFILLPTVTSFIGMEWIFKRQIIGNTSAGINYHLSQISSTIENDTSRLSHLISNIAYNYEFLELLKEYKNTEDYDYKQELSVYIDSTLRYLFYDTNEIESIIFFFGGEGYYYYKGQPIIEESEIRQMDWYRTTLNSNKVSVFTNISN